MKVSGNIVDVKNRRIYSGTIIVEDSKIKAIEENNNSYDNYIIPGFINSHVHIESSMLTPASFAHIAVKHGTVATVSDPHEIANVLGIEGVNFMIDNAKLTPLKIFFGAPSCVPATSFETSGATIDSKDIDELMQRDDIWYLSEMMNFPGVIFQDEEVHAKLKFAQNRKKPIDGHAPFLMGDDLKKYAEGGITTDHECVTIEEALQKIDLGIKIQIREGSAAKNFESLHSLISENPDMVMLCSDDSHPDDLINGFMNLIVKRAIELGHNIFDVLQSVSLNVIEHYNLPVGLLQVGDFADFIVVDNLKDFNTKETYINGQQVFDGSNTLFDIPKAEPLNRFDRTEINDENLRFGVEKGKSIKVIEAYDGDLTTGVYNYSISKDYKNLEADLDQDILKMVVLSRYDQSPVQIGYVKGFGLKEGAFASSIAHDSHNIIAVGSNDKDLLSAINLLIQNKGGVSFVNSDDSQSLALEIAGLMSNKSIEEVAQKYKSIDNKIKQVGSKLYAPLMTAAFMSLLVIPKLKLGDKGLFDVEKFAFTDLVS
jgi:adenine deaminase